VRGKSGIVLTRLLFCKTAGPDCFCLSAVNPCLSATYCFQPAPYFRYLSAFLCHHSKMVSLSVSACRLSLRQRTAASAGSVQQRSEQFGSGEGGSASAVARQPSCRHLRDSLDPSYSRRFDCSRPSC